MLRDYQKGYRRVIKGKSIWDIAKATGLSHVTVYRVFDGKPVSFKTMDKIVNYLELTEKETIELIFRRGK